MTCLSKIMSNYWACIKIDQSSKNYVEYWACIKIDLSSKDYCPVSHGQTEAKLTEPKDCYSTPIRRALVHAVPLQKQQLRLLLTHSGPTLRPPPSRTDSSTDHCTLTFRYKKNHSYLTVGTDLG